MTFRAISIVVVVLAAAVSGCKSLKPLEAEVATLKGQVSKLQSDLTSARGAADQAASSAQSAAQAAAAAQTTANQATAAAQSSQACCDMTNEKVDRMFKRSVTK